MGDSSQHKRIVHLIATRVSSGSGMTTNASLVIGAILTLPQDANMIPLSRSLRMSRAAGVHRVHRVGAVVLDTLSTSIRTAMKATVAVTVITGSKQREMNVHPTTSRATSTCRLRANAF